MRLRNLLPSTAVLSLLVLSAPFAVAGDRSPRARDDHRASRVERRSERSTRTGPRTSLHVERDRWGRRTCVVLPPVPSRCETTAARDDCRASRVWVPPVYSTRFVGYDRCGRPVYQQVLVRAGYWSIRG